MKIKKKIMFGRDLKKLLQDRMSRDLFFIRNYLDRIGKNLCVIEEEFLEKSNDLLRMNFEEIVFKTFLRI